MANVYNLEYVPVQSDVAVAIAVENYPLDFTLEVSLMRLIRLSEK